MMQTNKVRISFMFTSILVHLLFLSTVNLFRKSIADKAEYELNDIIFIYSNRVRIKLDKPVHLKSKPPVNQRIDDLILKVLNLNISGEIDFEKKITYPKVKPKHHIIDPILSYAKNRSVPNEYIEFGSKPVFAAVPLPQTENKNIYGHELLRYQEMIKQRINEQLVYPQLAKRSGIEGDVLVKFSILKDGQVSDIKIINSAYSILSRAATKSIRRASPFSALPKKLAKEKLMLKLTISFKLD